MDGTKKYSMTNAVKIAGAWVAYAIGSGFATGQDTLQYFCPWGVYGFAAIVIGIVIHIYVSSTLLSLGVAKKFENPMRVFDHYCGPYIGKPIAVLTLITSFGSPAVMIAGFGAVVNQNLGIPVAAGNAFMGLLCFFTIVLGLRKLVDIIGTIGPVLIIGTLGIGGYFLVTHLGTFSEGMALAPTLKMTSIGDSWWMSGIMFATWAPVSAAPFLIEAAKTIDTKTEAVAGSIGGNIFYGLAAAMLAAAFFCDIDAVRRQMVPILYLALQISPMLNAAFFILIMLGIYTSAVPGLYVICTTLAREKTFKYNAIAAVVCTAATIVTILMPFDRLLNVVYSVFAYLGFPFIAIMLARHIYDIFIKNK